MAVYYNDEGDLKLLAGSTNYQFCPIGAILPFGGTVAPNGFFLCQGQALSRTDYKELFGVIGTSFGIGDGSTTFNLPDLRGEFLRGAGTNSHSGEGSGGTVGQHQAATSIGTTYSTNTGGINFYAPNYDYSNADTFGPSSQGVINLNGAYVAGTTNASIKARPTNTSVNYIIKAKVVSEGDSESGDPGYSTSEIDTGKVWIDGKTIYRKCYTGTASIVSTNTLQIIDNNFTTTNGYRLLWAFGSVGHAEGQILTLPYQDSTVLATIQQVSGGLAFYHKNPVYAFTFEVMVEYTKN